MKRKVLWIVAGFVGTLAAVGCIGVLASAPSDPIGTKMGTSASVAPAPSAVVTTSAYHEPKAADFTLTVKILEKQCFGSAGCSITFRVDLSGGGTLDPDKTYELTYEVKGGEDPLINTLTVTGTKYERTDREHIDTSSSSKKLTVVIVSITEQ